MSDLIDRQQAIDAVDSETISTNPEHFKSGEKFIKFMDDADIASFGKWQWANGFNTALVATTIHLKDLPSAEPTYEAVREYCHKRCLSIVESETLHKLTSAEPRMKGKWIEAEVDRSRSDAKGI